MNSERLDNNSTVEERFNKFAKILDLLKEENIELLELANGNPVLIDDTCNFKMTHNHITWWVYPVTEVAEMIITARNKFKNNI